MIGPHSYLFSLPEMLSHYGISTKSVGKQVCRVRTCCEVVRARGNVNNCAFTIQSMVAISERTTRSAKPFNGTEPVVTVVLKPFLQSNGMRLTPAQSEINKSKGQENVRGNKESSRKEVQRDGARLKGF